MVDSIVKYTTKAKAIGDVSNKKGDVSDNNQLW